MKGLRYRAYSERVKRYLKKNWTKELNLFFFSLLFYLILIKVFEKLIKDKLINNILDECNSNYLNDLIFFIAIIYVIYFIHKKRNKTIQFSGFIILVFSSFVYTYYRFLYEYFNDYSWPFTSFNTIPFLKYSDPIFLICLTFIIQTTERKATRLTSGKKKFTEDHFKTFSNKDLLNRNSFANDISTFIVGTKTIKSFAIGVIGKWGIGKSIFLKFMGDKLLAEDCIVISFNPWRSQDSEKLLDDFFSCMISEIKKYDPKISNQLYRYADAINNIDDNFFTKGIKAVVSLFKPTESLESQYFNLEKSIKELQRRIVIFIDDVDRLDESEVFEVLRIIRNTASFPNTFFVVAYDKDYVVNTIMGRNDHNSRLFLEKIFQLEVELPFYQEQIVLNKLIELLKKDRSIADFLEIEIALNEINASSNLNALFAIKRFSLLKEYIKTLRDVVRFVNSFNLNYNEARVGEIDITDFIILELLKMKYSNVFNLLSQSKFSGKENVNIGDPVSEDKSKYIYDPLLASKFLEEKKSMLKLDDFDISLIKDTLNFLFHKERRRSMRSLFYPENHLLYFSPELYDKIPFKEFNNLRISNIELFYNTLDRWLAEGKEKDLVNIFYKTNEFSSKEDFESFIKSMLYLSKLDEGFWDLNLFEKVNKTGAIVAKYYNNDENEYKQFLLKIFSEAQYPYLGESTLARNFLLIYLRNQQDIKNLLSATELKNILIKFLKIYIEDSRTIRFIPQIVFRLYYNCYNFIERPSDIIKLHSEANHLFRNLIERFPLEYLETLIRPLYTPHDDKTYTFEPFVQQTFTSYSEFKAFLYKALKKNEYSIPINEVISFFRRFEANNYEPIQFKRNTIEFVSDSNTIFVKSTFNPSPQIVRSQTFDHFSSESYIPKIAKWITAQYPFPDEEAIVGGSYSFRFSTTIDLERWQVSKAKIIFIVDDYLNLHINGNSIGKDLYTPEFREVERDISVELFNHEIINKELGNVVFEFEVRNVPGGESSTAVKNPYGLIYLISLELTEKNKSKSEIKLLEKKEPDIDIFQHEIDKKRKITSRSREKFLSGVKFLRKEKGIFSIWAFIGDSFNLTGTTPFYKYIMAYATNKGMESNNPSLAKYFNLWAILRVTPTQKNHLGEWRFECSSIEKSTILSSNLPLSGWHLFTVAWSKNENYIKFLIDKNIEGEAEFKNWPSDFTGEFYIGKFPNDDSSHFFDSTTSDPIFVESSFDWRIIERIFGNKP